jgi:hypothetical protein
MANHRAKTLDANVLTWPRVGGRLCGHQADPRVRGGGSKSDQPKASVLNLFTGCRDPPHHPTTPPKKRPRSLATAIRPAKSEEPTTLMILSHVGALCHPPGRRSPFSDAKGNKADLKDHVLARVNAKEASIELNAAAAERASVAPDVPADRDRASAMYDRVRRHVSTPPCMAAPKIFHNVEFSQCSGCKR